jgi:hypothetical protein
MHSSATSGVPLRSRSGRTFCCLQVGACGPSPGFSQASAAACHSRGCRAGSSGAGRGGLREAGACHVRTGRDGSRPLLLRPDSAPYLPAQGGVCARLLSFPAAACWRIKAGDGGPACCSKADPRRLAHTTCYPQALQGTLHIPGPSVPFAALS